MDQRVWSEWNEIQRGCNYGYWQDQDMTLGMGSWSRAEDKITGGEESKGLRGQDVAGSSMWTLKWPGIMRSRVGERNGEPAPKSSTNDAEWPGLGEVVCKWFQQRMPAGTLIWWHKFQNWKISSREGEPLKYTKQEDDPIRYAFWKYIFLIWG